MDELIIKQRKALLNLIRQFPEDCHYSYNWGTLMDLAKEQSILGVVLQGIQSLPSQAWPPKNMLLKWISFSEAIRKKNKVVNNTLKELVTEFTSLGVRPLIVKGQVIAKEYKDPLLRQSGDIDVFIAKNDWPILSKWITKNHFGFTSLAPDKHIEIDYHGVTVELHHHLNAFSSKHVMKYWIEEMETKFLERHRPVKIEGVDVLTLGITDTLTHLLVHTHHHLLTEGVGLRQLMDMAMFIHNHFEELNLSQLHSQLVGIDHLNAFNAYMALLNKYLGLPKTEIPFELVLDDYVYADKIMQEVWRGGNFGYKNHIKGLKMGLLHSIDTARIVIGHSIKFYRLAPSEARAYWWHRLVWRNKRIMNIR